MHNDKPTQERLAIVSGFTRCHMSRVATSRLHLRCSLHSVCSSWTRKNASLARQPLFRHWEGSVLGSVQWVPYYSYLYRAIYPQLVLIRTTKKTDRSAISVAQHLGEYGEFNGMAYRFAHAQCSYGADFFSNKQRNFAWCLFSHPGMNCSVCPCSPSSPN